MTTRQQARLDVPPAQFLNLFAEFQAVSWDGWRKVLGRLTPGVREFYAIVGRGAGKSRIVSALAACFAAREYGLVPGENVYIGVFAPDRKQAGVTFRYIVGLMKSVPVLEALIVAEAKDSIELSNGVIIEVMTASTAAPRGRGYALVIVEEAAFLPADESANPDVELLRALRPALARVPGSLLAVISSPYARKGVLFSAWSKHHGNPDGDVVVVQASTQELNPAFNQQAIARAYDDDPIAAAAEYGAQFRSDVESLFSLDGVRACVVAGRRELPPLRKVHYRAFVDPSGGSADSFTLAIVHAKKGQLILDAIRERRPPFSPDAVVQEFAALLKSYRITKVTGDRYGGEWPRERFRAHGITYEPCSKSKSDLYLSLLPALNSGRVELLEHDKMVNQLAGLERRTARGGRDSVDHAPGSHDDVANAVAGALATAGESRQGPRIRLLFRPSDDLLNVGDWRTVPLDDDD